MREEDALPLLYDYAETNQKLLLELKDGQQIYCYAESHNESDPHDWGFNFQIAKESEGIDWMHGSDYFIVQCSQLINIKTA